MRKIIVFVACCLLLTVTGLAQTIKPGVGFNVSNFSENGGGDVKGQFGWQLGASASFGKKFYWEPGIYYVSKSTEFSSSSSAVNDFEATINGIRIPLALGLNLIGKENSTFGFRLFAGPSVFFVTSTGDDVDKDALKSTNWGVFAGVGIDFWIIFIDFAYEWSLTDVQEDNSAIDLGQARTFLTTAGVRLRL